MSNIPIATTSPSSHHHHQRRAGRGARFLTAAVLASTAVVGLHLVQAPPAAADSSSAQLRTGTTTTSELTGSRASYSSAAIAENTTAGPSADCTTLAVEFRYKDTFASYEPSIRSSTLAYLKQQLDEGQAGLNNDIARTSLPSEARTAFAFPNGTSSDVNDKRTIVSIPLPPDATIQCQVLQAGGGEVSGFFKNIKANAVAGTVAVVTSAIVFATITSTTGNGVVAGSVGGAVFATVFTLISTRLIEGKVTPKDWGNAFAAALFSALGGGVALKITQVSLGVVAEALPVVAERIGEVNVAAVVQELGNVEMSAITRINELAGETVSES